MTQATQQLPSHEQRRALCDMIAAALVEIRALAREANLEQIEDLADAFHNLPREMYGWGSWSPEITRGMLATYKQRHPSGHDYTAAFDEALARG